MTQPTIRPARPADAAALTAAIDAAYAIYAGRGLSLPPVSDGVAQAIAETPVFVADDAGEILGGIVLRLGKVAQIKNVAVTPAGTGKGLGRALIAAAEVAAREAGYDTLTLATHQDLAENLRFYTRLGWTETGREGVKVLMQKPL